MAHLLAVVDPDPARRAIFLHHARDTEPWADADESSVESSVLGESTRVSAGTLSIGDAAIAWSTRVGAPRSAHDGPGRIAALLGDAWLPGAEARVDAARLAEAWTRPAVAPAAAGFHVAAAYDVRAGLVVGADVLGLFPVYWWPIPSGGVVVASSTRILRAHPSFDWEVDLEGLAGILLTGTLFDGHSLLRGVRRLAPGHLLLAESDRLPRELHQFTPPPPARGSAVTLNPAVEGLDDALGSAMRRLRRTGRHHVLLLSGGRDSRLLAGYAMEDAAPVRALSLGRVDDFECLRAREAVRRRNLDVEVADVALRRYASLARRHVVREAVHGPLAGMHNLGIPELLLADDGALLGGHVLELAISRGPELAWAGDDDKAWRSTFWANVQARAVPESHLRRIVRHPVLWEAIADVRASTDSWLRSFEDPWTGVRLWLYRHWARVHPGGALWRFAGRAWPVTPLLDPELLTGGAAAAHARFGAREVQDALLARRFPDLAQAPLVRADGSFDPILPTSWWRLLRSGHRIARRLGVRADGPEWHRRRYRRIYDLDNEGWREVRRRAEPFRSELHRWFDAAALREYLPGPEVPLEMDCPITDSYGRKTMLGLMFWLSDQ